MSSHTRSPRARTGAQSEVRPHRAGLQGFSPSSTDLGYRKCDTEHSDHLNELKERTASKVQFPKAENFPQNV